MRRPAAERSRPTRHRAPGGEQDGLGPGDDEELARGLVREFLSEENDIEIVGECANGFDAVKAIPELRPDLLFLDVQMPKLDGFEVMELIDAPVEVIFVTAYDQFAMKAFDAAALDYLLKPFSIERFRVALERARRRLREKGATEELVNAAIRVTSVIHAIGVVLDTEKASPSIAVAGRHRPNSGRADAAPHGVGLLARMLSLPTCWFRAVAPDARSGGGGCKIRDSSGWAGRLPATRQGTYDRHYHKLLNRYS